MRVLIINKESNGIIELGQFEHYLLENVSSFSDIKNYLTKNLKDVRNYKYCEQEDETFIPSFIKISNKIGHEMGVFTFSEVKYNELNVSEEVKKNMIEARFKASEEGKVGILYNSCLRLIVDKELGLDVTEELLKKGAEIEDTKKSLENFDYSNFLNEYV